MNKNNLGPFRLRSLAGFGRYGLFLFVALFAFACSQADQQGKSKKKSSDKAGASDDDDDSGPGTNTKKKTGAKDDDPPDLGDDDDSAKADATVAALVKECGGDGVTNAPADKVIYEKNLKSLPITKTQNVIILTISATIETDLHIKVTGKETVQESKVNIVKLTPDSTLTRSTAEKQTAAASGTTTLTNVPFSDYQNLGKDKAWDGVLCTFVPVTKVLNERGGKKTIATFSPPLPSSVSPKADAKRYETEIGEKRVFSDIVAKIAESDNPDLQGKTSISGTITVEKVDAKQSVDDGAGGKKEIDSDLAYKITYDFGSPAATFALGFPPEVTYFISHSKKDLVANVVDTTATGTNGAVVIFVH